MNGFPIAMFDYQRVRVSIGWSQLSFRTDWYFRDHSVIAPSYFSTCRRLQSRKLMRSLDQHSLDWLANAPVVNVFNKQGWFSMVDVASDRLVRIIIAIIIITNGYLIDDPYIYIYCSPTCVHNYAFVFIQFSLSWTNHWLVATARRQWNGSASCDGAIYHHDLSDGNEEPLFMLLQLQLFRHWPEYVVHQLNRLSKNEGTSLFSSTDQWEWRSMNTTLKNPGTLFNSKFVKMPEFKQSKPWVSRRKSQQKPTANHKVTSSSCSVSNDIPALPI